MQAFKKWMRGVMEALDGDERKLMSARFRPNGDGATVGMRNAQTITTTGGGCTWTRRASACSSRKR